MDDNTEESIPDFLKPAEKPTPQAPMITMSVPKVLFEILIYATEGDEKPGRPQEQIKHILELLQRQVNQVKYPHLIRGTMAIDQGQRSEEEKRTGLLQESKCKYYTYLNINETSILPDNFVKKRFEACLKLEAGIMETKKLEIILFRPEQVTPIPE